MAQKDAAATPAIPVRSSHKAAAARAEPVMMRR